jgi:hypothetical protein
MKPKPSREFVCPIPMVWAEIYQRLCAVADTKGWEKPPVPLILAAWDAPAMFKMLRWKETVEWARAHGVAGLIPELTEEQKYYLGA